MPQETYRAALATYQAAVEGYLVPGTTRGPAAAPPGAPAAPADPAARAAGVEEASRAFTQAAVSELAADDPERRELARFQLLAGAVADLAVAQDLAAAAGLAPEAGTRGAAADLATDMAAGVPGEARPDVAAILGRRPEDGVRGLAVPPATRAARPTEAAAARDALRQAVQDALRQIPETAAGCAQLAFLGLVELPAAPVQQAAAVVAHEVVLKLGEGLSLLVRKAVSFILQAVDKVLTAFGPEARTEAGKHVQGWIDELKKGSLLKTLMDRAYEVPRIEQDVLGQLAAADLALGFERFNAAADALAALVARVAKQRDLLSWIVRGMAWARPVLLPLSPWGPLTLATGYVSLVGYSVWSGGDYVDWYRTQDGSILDRVEGVRTAVRKALTVAAG